MDPALVSLVRRRLGRESLYEILSDLEASGLDEHTLRELADSFDARRNVLLQTKDRPWDTTKGKSAIFDTFWVGFTVMFCLTMLNLFLVAFLDARGQLGGTFSISILIGMAIVNVFLYVAEAALLRLILNWVTKKHVMLAQTVWYFNYVILLMFFVQFFVHGLGISETELGSIILYFMLTVLSIPYLMFFFSLNFFRAVMVTLLFGLLNLVIFGLTGFLFANIITDTQTIIK